MNSVQATKATIVLACALTFAVPTVTQTTVSGIEPETPIEEVITYQQDAEIVIEEGAVEQQEAQNAKQFHCKFQQLAEEWKKERGAQATVAAMALLPSYQKIIGMGKGAIPLILEQLKSEGDSPDHWFWALAAISDENPVPTESRGKILEMSRAWLAWGQEKGHV